MASADQLEFLFDAGPSQEAPTGAPLASIPTPCPDPLPAGGRWREVQTEQQRIGFVLLRSRRRSIGFVVADDGLRVTAPNWVTLGQIDEAVREKARWILAKLRDWHTRREQLALAPVLGRHALGLLHQRRQHHAELAPDPLQPRHHRLRHRP